MPKRLLIVADAFPPAFAPRMGNLCKFLDGFDITVVTADPDLQNWPMDLLQNVAVHRFGLASKFAIVNLFYKLCNYAFSLDDRRLYAKANRALAGQKFDIVLCASFYIFPLLCGVKMAKKLQCPLVVDLRDIVEQYAQPVGFQKVISFFKLRWLNCWRRNRLLRSADVVTTVSPWHVAELQKHHAQVRLIYNGFDADDFYFNAVNSDKFTITYTGRLLEKSDRNPTLFFEAMRTLCKDTDFRENVRVRWFVDADSEKKILPLAQQFGIADCTELNALVSPNDIPDILRASSVVLVLTNKSAANGPHGVMTTKFFEALGCEKPVLCVPSDEDCLADVIRQTNAGVAAASVAEIEQFILEKYHEWQQFGYTHQPVNQEEKAKFSRQTQARQFEEIFCSLIS
jgi:glycosyltransferase involved in cell wall biosynthesis